jgi:hypothetical protein
MKKLNKIVKLSKGLIINILILFLIGFLTRFFVFYLNNSNLFFELESFIFIGFSLYTGNYILEFLRNVKNMYMHNLNYDIPYKTKFNTYNPKKLSIIKKNFGDCFSNKKDIETSSQISTSYILRNINHDSILRQSAAESAIAENEGIKKENQNYNLLNRFRRRVF